MRHWQARTMRRWVHGVAWWPLAYWLGRAALGRLTVNPIQALTQRLGLATLTLLLLTLACTPAARWLGWRWTLGVRRTLGLWTFAYATAHMLLFVGVDYGFAWGLLWQEILSQKPFVQVGLVAYGVLAVLAVTSFSPWPRRLGRWWKRLHRLVYLAAGLALVHYAWAVKGQVTALRGNVLGVLGYGVALAVLLALRWPRRKGKQGGIKH